jgi:hypothetical protein
MTIASPETMARLRNMSPEEMAASRREFDANFGPAIAAGPYGDGPGFGTGGVPGPLPPLPNDNAKGWLQDLLFSSTGNEGGNTLAQDLVGGNIGAGSSPTALKFLKGVGDKLKELWNRPIISPTITKPEHDLLIRGEGGGEKNWQNTPQY